MCTALRFRNCVGRNFDYEQSFKEQLIKITENEFDNKYEIIGIGTGEVVEYPLLYDGMNSCGLVCCGLAFEGNAQYEDPMEGKRNIPAYDFTFQILGNCESVEDAKSFLEDVNISCEPYSEYIGNSNLHWFIADNKCSIVVEQTVRGLNVYDAETDVLTNNPRYGEQLKYYRSKSNHIGTELESIKKMSRGAETWRLSGDYTSMGRFEKASYLLKRLDESYDLSLSNQSQAFHLLSSVEQVYGVTDVEDRFEYTIYSVVYNTSSLKVYVRTYNKIGTNTILFYGDSSRHDL